MENNKIIRKANLIGKLTVNRIKSQYEKVIEDRVNYDETIHYNPTDKLTTVVGSDIGKYIN